jgi:hypothetical protein
LKWVHGFRFKISVSSLKTARVGARGLQIEGTVARCQLPEGWGG